MKYGLGIRMLIAFVAGGIAVVYKIKINPRYKQSELNVAIKVPKRFVFDVLTTTKNVPEYFSWVTEFHESKFDKRNISIGKVYYGLVNMPFLGQHEIKYKVMELKDHAWVTLRPDKPKSSWFNTEITLTFFSITKDETHLGIKIAYHRTSALFQITLGRYLRYITDQQLERIGIAAKNLVNVKWEKHRFPHGRPEQNKKVNKMHRAYKPQIGDTPTETNATPTEKVNEEL